MCASIVTTKHLSVMFNHSISFSLLAMITESATLLILGFLFVCIVIDRRYVDKKLSEIADALKASEERNNWLVDFSSEMIAVHMEGKFVYINHAGAKLLGASHPEEIIGRNFFDFIHPDYRETIKLCFQQIESQGIHVPLLEEKLIGLDGKVTYLEVTAVPILYRGKSAIQIMAREITAKKEIKQRVISNEQRYRALFENNIDGIYSIDFNTKLIKINKVLEKIAGYKDEELIEMGFHKQEHRNEFRVTGIPIFNSNEVIGIHGIFKDVTERKSMERDLLCTKEQLQNIFNSIDVTVWSINRQTKEVFFSSGIQKITGYPAEYFLNPNTWLEMIHPDDLQIAFDIKHQIEQGQYSNREFRILVSDGQTRWVHNRAIPVKDATGEIVRIDGVLLDITDRKHIEDALRESEERYALLQTSMSRFSQDLLKVMKSSDLEDRLLKEIKDVLKIENVCVVEIDQEFQHIRVSRTINTHSLDRIKNLLQRVRTLSVGQLIDFEYGCIVKIGENHDKIFVLWIETQSNQALSRYERTWLATITHYVSVLYDNLHLIEELIGKLEHAVGQQHTPVWVLRLLFNLSEKERVRLAADLHDSVLQDQIYWYRKLETISLDPSFPEHFQQEIKQIKQGLLDVIHQIRLTCNELRPPFLKEMGLVEALDLLINHTRLFADYVIHFYSEDFHANLDEEQMINVYRIIQELLSNATKHANATEVIIKIQSQNENVSISYQDNGDGMDLERFQNSFQCMGLWGIKNRVQSLQGTCDFYSESMKGLTVRITFPVNTEDTSAASDRPPNDVQWTIDNTPKLTPRKNVSIPQRAS